MPKDKTSPSRTAGLGTRIQPDIHQAAKVYSAKTNKSLAELIEAGLQHQMSLGMVKLDIGLIIVKLRERARFYEANDDELSRAVEFVLKFPSPEEPTETVQDVLEEYGAWSKLYEQSKAEWAAVATSILSSGDLKGLQVGRKFDVISAELSDQLGRFRAGQLFPLIDKAVEQAVSQL